MVTNGKAEIEKNQDYNSLYHEKSGTEIWLLNLQAIVPLIKLSHKKMNEDESFA